MEKVNVKLLNVVGVKAPSYESNRASGMDIRANFDGLTSDEIEKRLTGKSVVTTVYGKDNDNVAILLRSGDRYLFPTGIKLAIPVGYEIQVRPRSGLALKHGITVVNTPGTIDADYRGEIGVILINNGHHGVVIGHNERIAQLVLTPVAKANFQLVDELDSTIRGEGGFNSTGNK